MPTIFAAGPIADSCRVDEVACDLCGSDDCEPLLTSRDRSWPIQSGDPDADVPLGEWQLVRCRECEFVYLNPRPELAALGQFYPGDYYAYSRPPRINVASWKSWLKQLLRRHRPSFQLAQLISMGAALQDPVSQVLGWMRPGRLLDVGCGAGEALDRCADLGWETWGVEPSQAAARTAERNGHRIWNGSLEECDVPDHSVDVVRMIHVLEHVPSPTLALRAIERVLRPGGRLIVEVPHIRQIGAGLFRDFNWSLDLPRHFSHFSIETLSRTVTAAGLRVLNAKSLCNPRQFLHCLELALQDPDGLCQRLNVSLPTRPLEDVGLRRSLEPFCQALAERGQGTSLLLIGEKPAS
ncbi:MAG: class I SAM-dependent methyltransferase [Planctomycetaceae bacterium]